MATGEPSGEASAEARVAIPSAAEVIERARTLAPTKSVTLDWLAEASQRFRLPSFLRKQGSISPAGPRFPLAPE